MIDHANLDIQTLTFRSMDASSEVEGRFLEEGFLKFGNHNVTYITKFNSAQHQLLRKSGEALSPELQLSVSNYLYWR